MPIPVIARKTRRIQAHDQAGFTQAYLGDQCLEAVPIFARCARLTEIVINDTNPLAWPAERDCPFNQPILQLRTFLMVADLPWRGLPHIDEAKLRAVRRRDALVSRWRRGQHKVFPPADAAGTVGVAADEPVAALAGVASRAAALPTGGAVPPALRPVLPRFGIAGARAGGRPPARSPFRDASTART